jgi:hypothetical protein
MKAYVFQGGMATGFSTDPSGGNLPTDVRWFGQVKSIETDQLGGPGAAEIIDGLQSQGWHVIKCVIVSERLRA